MKNTKKTIATILAASTLMAAGCSAKSTKESEFTFPEYQPRAEESYTGEINLTNLSNVEVNESNIKDDYLNFCLNLFAQQVSSESSNLNVMISPASIMFALEMTAAGAKNDTLLQMTNLISPDADPQDLQNFVKSYLDALKGNKSAKLNIANSVWMREEVMKDAISEDFIDYINKYYYAEANMADFDQATVDEINEWINDNTDGMIPKMINDISDDTVMILINAIAFDAKWDEQYEDYQVKDWDFNNSNGTVSTVNMMCSTEGVYYETEKATGFAKYYEGYDYYFLAILPTDETISANEFAMNFTAEDYKAFIDSRTNAYDVFAKLPEFSYDYDTSLVKTLMEMGMTAPFDPANANFDAMATIPGYNLFINNILHKTHIEVNQTGTKAAAVTVIIMDEACCIEEPVETREVTLDRPFCYAIVDANTNTPIFIGTVNEI